MKRRAIRFAESVPAKTRMADESEASVRALVDYVDELYSYAVALTRNHHEGEDLVQETYVRALQAVNGLRPDSNLKGWLFTVLRNVWLNQLRQRNSRPKMLELDTEGSTANLAPAQSRDPLAEYTQKWVQRQLRKAILQLPMEFREIVMLREYGEMSYEEIARLLSCPAGTVMSRLARARVKLRSLLHPLACSARSKTALRHAFGAARS